MQVPVDKVHVFQALALFVSDNFNHIAIVLYDLSPFGATLNEGYMQLTVVQRQNVCDFIGDADSFLATM